MSKNIVRWITMSLMLWFTISHVAAQATEVTIQVRDVEMGAFPQVAVPVQVRDEHGVPIAGLGAGAFEVLEASIDQPRTIASVEPRINPESQVSIMLVLDVSGSMDGAPLDDAKAATQQLVAKLGGSDRVALIAFADAVDLDGVNAAREVGFTDDGRAVLDVVDQLSADGGTPLYDALFKAVTVSNDATLGRRAILLLTDGVDQGRDLSEAGSAVASAETPIQEATQANIPIFTIGLGDEIDEGYLQRVALTTGGTYQSAPSSADLQSSFQNVLDRLKQEYIVTYTSGFDCDGATHRVEVGVEDSGRSSTDAVQFTTPSNLGCNPDAEPTAAVPDPTDQSITAPSPTEVIEVAPTDETVENETEPASEPAVEPAPTVISDPDSREGNLNPIWAVCGALLVLLLLVLFLWAWKRRSAAIP